MRDKVCWMDTYLELPCRSCRTCNFYVHLYMQFKHTLALALIAWDRTVYPFTMCMRSVHEAELK